MQIMSKNMISISDITSKYCIDAVFVIVDTPSVPFTKSRFLSIKFEVFTFQWFIIIHHFTILNVASTRSRLSSVCFAHVGITENSTE
jgi:hypothetical protein